MCPRGLEGRLGCPVHGPRAARVWPKCLDNHNLEGWLSGFRMVSGRVGCCRVGVGCCRAWRCRVGVKGCRGCQSVRTRVRLQGLSVLSGVVSDCRVVEFRVLSGGVGLSGLCRGEQPYFVVSGLHQGLTQTTANNQLRNRTQTCIP